MITAEMLRMALQEGAAIDAWVSPSEHDSSTACIDGWFDLLKAAAWLDAKLSETRKRAPLPVNVLISGHSEPYPGGRFSRVEFPPTKKD